jgi:hypothetical protein
MDLGGMGWGDVDWNGLAQDRDRWRGSERDDDADEILASLVPTLLAAILSNLAKPFTNHPNTNVTLVSQHSYRRIQLKSALCYSHTCDATTVTRICTGVFTGLSELASCLDPEQVPITLKR